MKCRENAIQHIAPGVVVLRNRRPKMNNPRQKDSVRGKPTVAAVMLTVQEAANYLRVSKTFLDKSRVSGAGPEFIRVGKRKILYRVCDLDAWAASRRYRSTGEYRV